MLKVIPVFAQAGISGFESPAAEYRQLKLALDELLIEHPIATFIGQASGESMTGVGIFDSDLLIVDRAAIAPPLDFGQWVPEGWQNCAEKIKQTVFSSCDYGRERESTPS